MSLFRQKALAESNIRLGKMLGVKLWRNTKRKVGGFWFVNRDLNQARKRTNRCP